ncbi:MAG: hypothetical protein ACTHK7_12365 [Aureliella sp.]
MNELSYDSAFTGSVQHATRRDTPTAAADKVSHQRHQAERRAS